MAKSKREDTTVSPITGSFEDAMKAMLKTPPAPRIWADPRRRRRRRRNARPVVRECLSGQRRIAWMSNRVSPLTFRIDLLDS